MKAPTDNDRKHALKLHAQGKKMKEIVDATGMNYSQVWVVIRESEIEDDLRVNGNKRTPAKVVALRNDGCSWGEIAVRFGIEEYPESKIRKMYEEASGMKSIGLRVGKGGRHLMDEPIFYRDEHARTGYDFKTEWTRAEIREEAARLIKQGVSPKKAMAVAKKTAARTGAVKTAKKAAKKTTKKATKKAAKRVEVEETDEDPFAG